MRQCFSTKVIFPLCKLLLLGSVAICTAEVDVTPTNKKVKTETKVFSINSVIAPQVTGLTEPETYPSSVGVTMGVSSPSEKAREHVKQGFALIHAQWDFEAYRHFCAAIKEDKECLLAYCGVSLALAQPYNEYTAYKRAAVDRMLDLMEADAAGIEAGKPERYPEVEKRFCAAAATMVSGEVQAAGKLFLALGKHFPNMIQAKLLGVFLLRDGYDVLGNARPAQSRAIEDTKRMLEEHPENPLVMGFWASICAEAPHKVVNLKSEVIPVVRKLTELAPNVPSWWHILGHLEWRVGNYLLAEQAFMKSSALYTAWMIESGAKINDCPGLIKAKCYLANTKYHRGDFIGAINVAKEVRALPLDIKRPNSEGNHILLWRGYNLQARLYMAHGADGDMNRGLKSLPSAEELKPFAEHKEHPTLAGAFTNALRVYMGCRKAIDEKNLTAATSLHRDAYRSYLTALGKVAKGARRSGGSSHFFHGTQSLAIYDKELTGMIRMNAEEATRIAAVGSFLSARDLQYIPTLMTPPMVILPMENRLGEYYLHMGKNTEAYESYTDGYKKFPNNIGSLRGMKRSLIALGDKEKAEEIQKHIDVIKPKK